MRRLIFTAIIYLIAALVLSALAFADGGHGNPFAFHLHSDDVLGGLVILACVGWFLRKRFFRR